MSRAVIQAIESADKPIIKYQNGEVSLEIGELVVFGNSLKVLGSGSVIIDDFHGQPVGIAYGVLATQITEQLDHAKGGRSCKI